MRREGSTPLKVVSDDIHSPSLAALRDRVGKDLVVPAIDKIGVESVTCRVAISQNERYFIVPATPLALLPLVGKVE